MRQLALLADRNKPGRKLMGDRATEDEAARLDARDLVDLRAGPGLHQFVDRAPERPRVAEQGGDVAEQDAGFWVIGNRADRGGEIVHGGASHRPHSAVPSSLSKDLCSGASVSSGE